MSLSPLDAPPPHTVVGYVHRKATALAQELMDLRIEMEQSSLTKITEGFDGNAYRTILKAYLFLKLPSFSSSIFFPLFFLFDFFFFLLYFFSFLYHCLYIFNQL